MYGGSSAANIAGGYQQPSAPPAPHVGAQAAAFLKAPVAVAPAALVADATRMCYVPYNPSWNIQPAWVMVPLNAPLSAPYTAHVSHVAALKSFSPASAASIISHFQTTCATPLVASTQDKVVIDVTNWISEMRRTGISWRALLQRMLGIKHSDLYSTVDSSSFAACSLDAPDAMKELMARGFNIITCERKPTDNPGDLGKESELVDLILHAFLRLYILNPVPPGSVTIHLMTSDGNDKNPCNSNLPDLVMLAACAGYRVNIMGLTPGRGFSVVQGLFPAGMVTVTSLGVVHVYGKKTVTLFTDESVRDLRALMAPHDIPLPAYRMVQEEATPLYEPTVLAFAHTCMEDGRIEEYEQQLWQCLARGARVATGARVARGARRARGGRH